MKETFKSLNEAFNLPHSITYVSEDFNDYTQTSVNTRFKKNRIKVSPKQQIIKVIRDNNIRYQRKEIKTTFDIEDYVDKLLKTLIEEQEEFIKPEYVKNKEKFRQFIEELDKELGLCNQIERKSSKELNSVLDYQKSKIPKRANTLSRHSLKRCSWVF